MLGRFISRKEINNRCRIVDTIHFPYEHICVLSGIEIMRKEFEGLVKERLRLDPTQAQNFIIV